MKKRIVFFLTALLFIASIQAEETRGLTVSLKELGLKENLVGRQYLVMIAVDRYEKWLPLKNPVKDAREVKNILTSLYYIDEVIELYDKEATKANIMKLFEKLASRLTVTDSLLLYYAGHGYLDKITDTGFWIPVNGGTDVYAQENWLPNTQIRGIVSRLKASHICLIADACFSGDILSSTRGISPTIDNDYFKKAYERTSRQVLTSGASEAVPDKSEFCRLLKMALEKNKSPYLDPVMLYNEIRLGVKDTLPMSGNLKETGHQDGASFLLFLKPEKQEARTAEAPAPISPRKAAQPTPAATPAEAPAAQPPAPPVEAGAVKAAGTPETGRKQTQEKELVVSAMKGWQDTGIVIAKGDSVLIEYISGKWATHFSLPLDADGIKNDSSSVIPRLSLIGRIGKDQPFFVGNRYTTKEAERTGGLSLRMNVNDVALQQGNNGFLRIRIAVNAESSAAAVKAGAPMQKPAQEKSFTAMSQKGWQDTGITVANGDHVYIEYDSGKWKTSSNSAWVDAKGEKNNWAGAPLPSSPASCLLGRIGVDQPFMVGNLFETKEAGRAGKLYLRINDSDEYLYDNVGSLKILIVVNGETNREKRFLRDNFAPLTEYEGRKYYLSKNIATWPKAKEMCEKGGGHLATILTAEENTAIISALKEKRFSDNAWIGCAREYATWSWVTGEKAGFMYWEPGEPNNAGGGQDRTHIWSGHNYKWADGERTLTYHFLLEIE